MRRGLVGILMGLALVSPAAAQDWLPSVFDPDTLTRTEKRIVQAALVWAGSYGGPIDGDWDAASRDALAAYAADISGQSDAKYRDLIPLVLAFRQEWAAQDWQVIFFEDTDTSFLFPNGLLHDTGGDGAYAWENEGGTLSVSFDLSAYADALTQHRIIYARRVADADRYQVVSAERLVTSVVLRGGSNAYLRSDPVQAGYATVALIADDEEYQRLALMALSIAPGQAAGLEVPETGVLATLMASDEAVLAEKPGRRGVTPGTVALSPKDAKSTGSGFYVNAGSIVTAAHVVEGCRNMSLSDGSRVGVLLSEPGLDLAVLASEVTSATWLNLRAEVAPRLGETVYALGYPYLGLLNQGLAVTGGNVSAMGGIDPGEVRIMVSAPVQPGNSGGPLVNSAGDVVGVVVSRIDDMSIFDQTGTLPQNMNFAVPPSALVEFLGRAEVKADPVVAEAVDLTRGIPDAMRDAVVPLFCY